MIVRPPLSITFAKPFADVAVLHRLWVRTRALAVISARESKLILFAARRTRDLLLHFRPDSIYEPSLYIPVVRRVFRNSVFFFGKARARWNHVQVFRGRPLNFFQQVQIQ